VSNAHLLADPSGLAQSLPSGMLQGTPQVALRFLVGWGTQQLGIQHIKERHLRAKGTGQPRRGLDCRTGVRRPVGGDQYPLDGVGRGAPDHEHRANCLLGHTLGHASQHQVRNPAHTPVSHHD